MLQEHTKTLKEQDIAIPVQLDSLVLNELGLLEPSNLLSINAQQETIVLQDLSIQLLVE